MIVLKRCRGDDEGTQRALFERDANKGTTWVEFTLTLDKGGKETGLANGGM